MYGALSPKQLEHVLQATARLNLADGPVRAGKTVGNNVAWVEMIEGGPRGELLMLGKTERTLHRNVLVDMERIFGRRWHHNAGKGEISVKTSWGHRLIYVAGANDLRAEEKIRGLTIAGAYCNEVSLYPETVFNQTLARMSVPGARLYADTNPDSPHHWFHTGYLTNEDLLAEGIVKRFKYKLEDNIFLDPQYVSDLKRLYTGLWYKRMILGLWVMAQGAIYDMFDEDVHVVEDVPEIRRYWVTCDYGTTNPTVFLLVGEGVDGVLYVIAEYRWDSAKEGRSKTDGQYAVDLTGFMDEYLPADYMPERIFVDPSAASFITQLYLDGEQRDYRLRRVVDADNAVNDGIRYTATLMANNRLRIHKRCKGLMGEVYGYVWDSEHAIKTGEDKPLKVADHGPDALRYGINGTSHVWSRWLRGFAA